MASPFQDFIPAGEDAGAAGKGFTDFVPTEAPQRREELTFEELEHKPKTLEEKTVRELRDILEARGVDTRKMKTKKDLLDAITAGETEPTPAEEAAAAVTEPTEDAPTV